MSTYVTPAGLVLPSFNDIKNNLGASIQNQLGSDISLSPDGAIGQIIEVMTKGLSDITLAIQEVYSARNPLEATGTSLDHIYAEIGLRRIDASPTRIENVLLGGSIGAVIPAGSLVTQSGSVLLFSLDTGVEISSDFTNKVEIEILEYQASGLVGYYLQINGYLFSYVSVDGDTKTDILNELKDAITAGNPGSLITNGGVLLVEDERLYITSLNTTFSCTSTVSNIFNILYSVAGDFVCTTDGANVVAPDSLTSIVTPVLGWDTATNPEAGRPGRLAETDSEFRIRASQTLGQGSATDIAIRNAILNSVEGITAVSCTSNRTMTTDIDGRPPKSFEVVAGGGDIDDIAQTIWENMPSGIQAFGDIFGTATDTTGISQTIRFSRPVQKYLHVRVKRALYSEEIYPTNGDAAIKQAIVDWAAINYQLGTDVIYQRLVIPVYTVQGIGSVQIEVDVTDNPTDIPNYVSANFTISSKQFVTAAVNRIVVETLV